MSYSLFSYLKENPRLNGPKVNYNWAKILTDPEVPASVKTELNELIDYKFITLSDAVLFWSDHVQMLRMTDAGEYKVIRGKSTWCTHKYEIYLEFGSQFALTMYSLIQLDPDNATQYAKAVYNDIFNMPLTRELYTRLTNWTIDKARYLFSHNRSLANTLGAAYYNNSNLDNSDCYDLYDWLDEEFMSRIGPSQIREVRQLVKDCDRSTIKFRSMNDVERAHDARTEREAAKLARDELTMLSYHPELVKVATQYGFTLPPDNISFIKRGKQHSNCVATYYSKHIQNTKLLDNGETREVSRLFFTANATLELSIEYCAQGIVSTKVIQYKGRFNKDTARDKTLIALRVTLVGMPTEILEVTRSTKHEKDSNN
jgi:hypothetical protein